MLTSGSNGKGKAQSLLLSQSTCPLSRYRHPIFGTRFTPLQRISIGAHLTAPGSVLWRHIRGPPQLPGTLGRDPVSRALAHRPYHPRAFSRLSESSDIVDSRYVLVYSTSCFDATSLSLSPPAGNRAYRAFCCAFHHALPPLLSATQPATTRPSSTVSHVNTDSVPARHWMLRP